MSDLHEEKSIALATTSVLGGYRVAIAAAPDTPTRLLPATLCTPVGAALRPSAMARTSIVALSAFIVWSAVLSGAVRASYCTGGPGPNPAPNELPVLAYDTATSGDPVSIVDGGNGVLYRVNADGGDGGAATPFWVRSRQD